MARDRSEGGAIPSKGLGSRLQAIEAAAVADAFEAASTGMALIALDGRFLAVNAAMCQLLARDAETLLASSLGDVTHAEDLATSRKHSTRMLTGKIASCQHSKRFLLPEGGIVWGLLTVTAVRDAGGELLHYVAQIQDISDRKTSEAELGRYAAQLEALSEQDPLTGLPNRHAFRATAMEELRVLALGGTPFSVLVAAIDGDDASLIAATEALARVSRRDDLVAYLGNA
jgi:PAS domain S-box-containing protein